MREIKFRAKLGNTYWDVETWNPHHKSQGYIYRRVNGHPFMTRRGYVREQRLVMEAHLKRFLFKNEFIHHIDGNRENNDLSNLRLYDGQSTHASGHARGKRNPNGRFVASEPIFEQIKFRLLNTNSNKVEIYTLSELIGKTYRKGQFKFRGRGTGLHDRNGKEIWEGDFFKNDWRTSPFKIIFYDGSFRGWYGKKEQPTEDMRGFHFDKWEADKGEVIGNIYENSDLLEGK